MHQQINEHFKTLLSKFQCGFRQGFSAQHCLLLLVEKMKKIRDNKGVFVGVLTDLSDAFDCIPHGLLIAKLNAFSFNKKPLSFISVYLYNRKQKTKVGSEFSDFLNILFGVPQGSKIDGNLTFHDHIMSLCSKANKKLSALSRVSTWA